MNELRRNKALIRLGYACNNSCVFCHSASLAAEGRPELETGECMRRIEAAARAGADMVVFSGGEPAIRKDIIELCRHAGNIGLESGIITNGRMLSYRDFAVSLVEAGARYILISLHGEDAETHNFHARSDSFHQTILGIKHAAALDTRLVVNTVLTSVNSARLHKITRLLETFAPLRHKISLPEPKGAALNNFQFVLSPSEAAAAAKNLLRKAGTARGVQIGFDGFTPCLLKDYFSLNDDFFTNGFCMVSSPGDSSFFPPDHGMRSYPDVCLSCSVKHICPGIYSEYLRAFPAFSPEPLCRPVSNSLRFDLCGTHSFDDDEQMCRATFLRELSPWRALAVKKGNRMALYQTKEVETDAPELHKIKVDLEQVYFYDSETPENHYEPAHLKKMEIMDKCLLCARRNACPGIFKPSRKTPYSEVVSETLSINESLKGRMLEVGCGEGPFFEFFRGRIRSGAITLYVGIDPEISCEERSEDGRFILHRSCVEDFEWHDEPFDCVAMFRSYQHVLDLDRAMAVLFSVMKPGGSLIITEDYKHIELHNEPDTRAAASESRGPRFQHFRNHSSFDSITILKKHGFLIKKIRRVTPDSAPVWTVIAEKPL